ncbi:MAG: nitrous oxide reductase accessory protein NosL [Deltaproteobacteria bacterium]|nr:nitrous oxide reductase accessory protein NosL [Deltaproteobacteria bacterium]
MTLRIHRRDALWLIVSLAAACRRAPVQRCAHCGMSISPTSRWRAGAETSSGPIAFDTPSCMVRYRFATPSHPLQNHWVIEYYGPANQRRDVREVRFVAGSRVVGPMGPDFVPVTLDHVADFRRDHGGREALPFDQLTQQSLGELTHP